MSKKILLFVIVVLCFASSKAQTFNLGAKAGVNFVVLTGDASDNHINKFNYHMGGVGRIGISEKFALQPELLYSTQRYSFDSYRFYMDYINLPIMADVGIAKGLSLQAGPQFGFNIKNRMKLSAGDDYPGMDEKLENAKSVVVGAGVGAQYQLPINLFFQARYTFGITDIYDDGNLKQGMLSLSVGYFLF